jgi:regulatory protein
VALRRLTSERFFILHSSFFILHFAFLRLMARDHAPRLDPDSAHIAALRLLNYRFRSVEELRGRLREKGFPDDVIKDEIARLTDEGWLDDRRFAEQYAKSLARRRKGRRRIEAELREFGVDAEIVRAAIAEALEEHPEAGSLDSLLEKKAAALERRHGGEFLNSDLGRKKLAAYLFSHGYDAPAVFAALDRRRKKQPNVVHSTRS